MEHLDQKQNAAQGEPPGVEGFMKKGPFWVGVCPYNYKDATDFIERFIPKLSRKMVEQGMGVRLDVEPDEDSFRICVRHATPATNDQKAS